MSDPFLLNTHRSIDPFLVTETSLRKNVQDFILKFPMWLLFVRHDERYPCAYCFDPTTKSGSQSCSECFGTGYRIQYEKHAVRKVITANEVQSPIEEYGYLNKYKTIIYCPRYYYPKSKDIYLEVEWDVEYWDIEDKGRPTNLIAAYQVDEIIAFKQNEVTYIGLGADNYDFSKLDIGNWVLQIGQNYIPKKVV